MRITIRNKQFTVRTYSYPNEVHSAPPPLCVLFTAPRSFAAMQRFMSNARDGGSVSARTFTCVVVKVPKRKAYLLHLILLTVPHPTDCIASY